MELQQLLQLEAILYALRRQDNFQLVAKPRASPACQVISFMVLNLSRFEPKKLW